MDKERILELLLKSIEEGIQVVNTKGKTVIYNEQMAFIENMNREDVLNQQLTKIMPDIKRNSTHMEVQKSRKPIVNNKQIYFNKNGKKISTLNSTYPIIDKEKIIGSFEISKNVTKLESLSDRIVALHDKKETDKEGYNFNDIIGVSEKIKRLIEQSKNIAKINSNVLIIGESGTGKELFSQSIHNLSRRRNRSYVAENCAAIPSNLLESILFGTKKGGFTGAENKEGLFKKAHGGTLVLDEINSMPLEIQSKLLRVLETGKFRPIGGDREEKVDVRIIAIANKDPLGLVKENKFREDLFYRLSVINLSIPPLRDRKEDIKPLIDYFVKYYERIFNVKIKGISKEAMEFIIKYHWPGNVRELKHVIEGAISLLDNNDEIKVDNFPYYINVRNPDKDSKHNKNKEEVIYGEKKLETHLEEIEKEIIIETLKENNMNITKSAKSLGIKRQGLQYKIRKYDIEQNNLPY
ncbi:MAG: sigma 54-interacting transcriptional regulator [Eubacteriales bacterium]